MHDLKKMTQEQQLDLYDEFLDEAYQPYNIGYLEWTASHIMKELDPTAYRIGFQEWVDDQEANNA